MSVMLLDWLPRWNDSSCCGITAIHMRTLGEWSLRIGCDGDIYMPTIICGSLAGEG
jgi:hypothetical protein